ncbi:hypothetical protein [Kribbella qitaiheensis]|uniref:hypothetical protein n=1 Tax=Kribbella qitaiheensis TaxID=1544730 RepID=UPI0019D4FC69|nr:hypothetical protein [Kribbella qitaiheensis]
MSRPSLVGWYMIRHSSATTAIGTTTGRNAADRMKLSLRVCPSTSSASPNPSSIEPNVCPTASTIVFQVADRKLSELRISL